jgi:hypothetical protein
MHRSLHLVSLSRRALLLSAIGAAYLALIAIHSASVA